MRIGIVRLVSSVFSVLMQVATVGVMGYTYASQEKRGDAHEGNIDPHAQTLRRKILTHTVPGSGLSQIQEIRHSTTGKSVSNGGDMNTNVVNLDALIPRDDFEVDSDVVNHPRLDKIDIHLLESGVFSQFTEKA